MAESINNTWSQVGNDVFLTNANRTLIGGVIDVSNSVYAANGTVNWGSNLSY